VGVEAALYARFLGYDVHVLEQGRIGGGLLRRPQDAPPMPVKNCCSPLGLRALLAQDPRWSPPELEVLWTPEQYVESYLAPLAHTDLLDSVVLVHTKVIDIARTETSEEEADAVDDTSAQQEEPEAGWVYEDEPPRLPPLRVTVQPSSLPASSLQPQAYYDADIVIDASGCNPDGPDYGFLKNLRLDPGSQVLGTVGQLVLPEPNFYILGSKKHGTGGDFTIPDGLRQIRELFALIGGRAGLDLYQPLSPAQ